MYFKNRLILSTLLCLLPLIGFAKAPTTSSKYCIMLGSTPSLIIKFIDISSKKTPLLGRGIIRGLTSNKAVFTSSRAMSGGAYIVFFTPSKMMQSEQIKPGCYSQSIIDLLMQDLKTKGNIEYVDPNSLMSVSKARSHFPPVIDPIQWDMLSPPGGIDTQTAFNTTMGNPNVITAVLDSGILNNDSLNPNVLSGVTFNNNGSYNIGAAPSCDSSCEGNYHGTHVAGTIAASGVLAYGRNIYGVAPNSKVLPVNVFTKHTDPINCDGSPPCLRSQTVDEVNALNWLAGESFLGLPKAQYVAMVNMSLGRGSSTCDTSMQRAFNKLISNNISIAVAAGNGINEIPTDAKYFTPANCIGVMPVAATDRSGYGAYYSNYGSIVSFAAPGGSQTFPNDPNGIYSTVENAYEFMQGTSMASPHAAGLGALLYSVDPTLTPSTLLNIIKSTATPFPPGGPGASCTLGRPCGAGIIDANMAVLAAVSQAPVLTWTPNISSIINTARQATITWQAAAWSPSRSTGIIYTVNLNGQDIVNCSFISSTSCVLKNLVPDSSNIVVIKATDIRQIYGPSQTSPYTLNVTVTAPTLSSSARNPLIYTQAYIYYSSLGGPPPDSYVLNGAPSGVTLKLDASHNRFILNNIFTLNQIDNVSITSVYGSVLKESNTISIPGVTITMAELTFAVRNPLILTTAYIYYSNLGGPPPDNFVIKGLPSGAKISVDTSKKRFIIDNITTPKQIDNVTISAMYSGVGMQTNSVSIPSIL